MDLAMAAIIKAENLEPPMRKWRPSSRSMADQYNMDLEMVKKYLQPEQVPRPGHQPQGRGLGGGQRYRHQAGEEDGQEREEGEEDQKAVPRRPKKGRGSRRGIK